MARLETLTPGGVYWGTCARMTHTAAFDADDIEAPESAHSDGWLRETIVHVSIVTVIVALGVALRTSFGFGIVAAIVTSLTVYWGLLLIHALVRRGAGCGQPERRRGRTRGGERRAAPDVGARSAAEAGADAGTCAPDRGADHARVCRGSARRELPRRAIRHA